MKTALLTAALLAAAPLARAADGPLGTLKAPEPGPPPLAPYTSCYLSVHPFSDGDPWKGAYPLAGDAAVLPGSLGKRRGVFAYLGAQAFFHQPAARPRRPLPAKKRPSGYPDVYELILRLPEERELLLVYKERFKKPAAKRAPGAAPLSLALYPVSYLDREKTESAALEPLTGDTPLSDALSLMRRKLAERIDSMVGHYKKSRGRYKKDIVGTPGPSEYYKSLKEACGGIEDHAVANAVDRTRRYFLKRR